MFNSHQTKPELRIIEDPLVHSPELPSGFQVPAPAFSRSNGLFRRGTGGPDGTDIPVPDLWQHPLLSIHGEDVLTNTLNWRNESKVDVLSITGKDSRICKYIRLDW